MIKKLSHLLFLFTLPHLLFSQIDPIKPSAVSIHFDKDADDAALYHLNCEANTSDLFGNITFYNATGRVIYQMENVEIPFSPGYHLIDVSTYPKQEEITIEIMIDDVSYTKKVRL